MTRCFFFNNDVDDKVGDEIDDDSDDMADGCNDDSDCVGSSDEE